MLRFFDFFSFPPPDTPRAGPPARDPSAGPRSAGPPKISRFFSLSRPHFRSFSLSGGLLVEIWWCLKRLDPQMWTFGVLGLSCETPAAVPDPRASTLRTPTLGALTFSRSGPPTLRAPFLRAPPFGPPLPSSGDPPGLHFFWVWAPTFLIFYHVAHCFFCVFLIVSISFF